MKAIPLAEASPPPALLLARLRAGADSAEVWAWLQAGFASWMASGGAVPLHAALGLPASPVAVARAERDIWLREAAQRIAGTPWARAEGLRAEILRVGAMWDNLAVPPRSATPAQACLFFALKTGAPLPRSTRRIYGIITEAISENASEKVAARTA